ncbi:hypothetical protein ACLOJK_038263 [Asimina triloba]
MVETTACFCAGYRERDHGAIPRDDRGLRMELNGWVAVGWERDHGICDGELLVDRRSVMEAWDLACSWDAGVAACGECGLLAGLEMVAIWIVAGVEMGSLARVCICCCWRGICDGHWSLAGSWPDADGFGRDGSRWRLDGRR